MIHFASAQYLLLIFVIPFFFIFYALYRRGRRRKIEALGDVKLLERLMPARSKVKGWVRISFFSAAWFFFVIGLARPQIGARLKETNRKGAEIMIALDVSNSMLAEDYSPNRLERAKLAISRLVANWLKANLRLGNLNIYITYIYLNHYIYIRKI